MEQTNNNIESLYGRVVKEARPCDKCKFEKNDCRKVEVNGVGMLCLVKDKHTDWRKKYDALAKEKEELELRHQNVRIALDNAQHELDRSIPATSLNDLQQRYDDVVEESANMSKEMTELRGKYNDQLKADEHLSEQINELRSRNSTLEASNKHMEDELNRVRAQRDELSAKCSEALADNKRMHDQSLWQRIFNR